MLAKYFQKKQKLIRSLSVALGVVLVVTLMVPTTSNAQYWAENGKSIYNTNPGYVGIGTEKPVCMFHVNKSGTGHLASFQGTYTVMDILMPVTGGGQIKMYSDLAGTPKVLISSSPNFNLGTSYFTAGNVGIGTTTPSRMLDVAGDIGGLNRFNVHYPTTNVYDDANSNSPYSRVEADSFHTRGLGVGQLFIEGRAIDSNSRIEIGKGVAGGMAANDIQIGDNFEIYVDTSENKVGIGKSNPSATLDVNGTIAMDGVLGDLGVYGDLSVSGSIQGGSSYAIGAESMAVGYLTQSLGHASVALGDLTVAEAAHSFAIGYQARTTVDGYSGTALGKATTAAGWSTTAMGYSTTAQAYASLVIGKYNEVTGTHNSWVDTDPVFVIGNGTYSNPSNAFTVYKNGNVKISGNITSDGDICIGNCN